MSFVFNSLSQEETLDKGGGRRGRENTDEMHKIGEDAG